MYMYNYMYSNIVQEASIVEFIIEFLIPIASYIFAIILAFSTIKLHKHIRKKDDEEKKVLLHILDLEIPDSSTPYPNRLELIYENRTTEVSRVINHLKEHNFKCTHKPTLKNHKIFNNTKQGIYYQPTLLTGEEIAEGSLVMNLLDDNDSKTNTCVCKNVTLLTLKNFGAPLRSLYIKECVITYRDSETPLILKSSKEGSMIPLFIDTGNNGFIRLTEVTNNLKNTLCEIGKINFKKKQGDSIASKVLLNYEKITMKFVATSVYGVDVTLEFSSGDDERGNLPYIKEV